MTRTQDTQAMTSSANDLVIGLMQVRAAEISNVDTSPVLSGVSGTPSPDALTSPIGTSESIGALQSAGLETTLEEKTHESGYPAQVDYTITESTAAVYNVTMEELIGTTGYTMLQNILDTLENGTQHFYAIDSTAMYQNGETLSIYTPCSVLKPELNISIGDDWGGLPVQFEALYKSNFTTSGGRLLLPTRDTAPTSRDRTKMPITLDTSDLLIGSMQFRVGLFHNRAATTAEIYPARKVVGDSESLVTTVTGNTYTGAGDGAFIITISTGGASDGTAEYTLTDLEGNSSSATTIPSGGGTHSIGVDVTTSAVTSDNGVDIVFANGTYDLNDVYVIGVAADDDLSSATQTNIISAYPYLPSTKSIGSIISTGLTSNITYKEHYSGYPKKKDSSIMESSEIMATCAIEEFNMPATTATLGKATTVAAALFDAAESGSEYFAPVEVIATSVSGKTLSFWLPNAKLVPALAFAPSNDWANSTVEFKALSQSGITTPRIQTNLRS